MHHFAAAQQALLLCVSLPFVSNIKPLPLQNRWLDPLDQAEFAASEGANDSENRTMANSLIQNRAVDLSALARLTSLLAEKERQLADQVCVTEKLDTCTTDIGSGWMAIALDDKTGAYFWNKETNETRWERPPALEPSTASATFGWAWRQFSLRLVVMHDTARASEKSLVRLPAAALSSC